MSSLLSCDTKIPGLTLIHEGKVRMTYEIPGHPDLLFVVATNRVSTHDTVHKSLIQQKGENLVSLTVFWMDTILKDIPNHLVAYGRKIYKYLPKELQYPFGLHLCGVIVHRLNMIPVEFVYRSRMAGSLWTKYYAQGKPNPYGLDLPLGLRLMSPFADIVFTPTQKLTTAILP